LNDVGKSRRRTVILFSPLRSYSPCSSGSCTVCWSPHTFRSQPARRCTAQRPGDFGQRRLPCWRSAAWSSVPWLWCVPSVRSAEETRYIASEIAGRVFQRAGYEESTVWLVSAQ
jgi:hypothetical protein